MNHAELSKPATPLDEMRAGGRGVVAAVATITECDRTAGMDVARRLMELGFIPGERLRVLHRAPGGEPIAVRVGHSTFALRRFEAALISVVPERP